MAKIIYGDTVGTPAPRPDWEEKNEKSASYIKNKPIEEIEKSAKARHTHENSQILESFREEHDALTYRGKRVSNESDLLGLATKDELSAKVDKEEGKSLISDSEIKRLASLASYDDTEIKEQIDSKASIDDMVDFIKEHKEELRGKDGYTPIKGVDYFDGKDYVLTEDDKEDISKLVEVNVPTKVSDLVNDSGYLTSIPEEYVTETELEDNYLTSEADPTVPNYVKSITESDISNWNNKSDFSGSYTDLTDKPTMPTKVSELENDEGYQTEGQVYDIAYQAAEGWYLDVGNGYIADYAPTKEELESVSEAVEENYQNIESLSETVGGQGIQLENIDGAIHNLGESIDEKIAIVEQMFGDYYSKTEAVEHIHYVIHDHLLAYTYSHEDINAMLGQYITDVSNLIDENLELLGGEVDE